MTTSIEARRLRRLHDELRELVKELCDPAVVTQIHEDRTTTSAECPSLLDQLNEAIGVGVERGKSYGTSYGSKIPLSVGAIDLYQKLHRDWCGTNKKRSLEETFRFIPEWVSGWSDVDQLSRVVERVRKAVKDIRDLLDPPRRFHLPAPCPSCHTKMIRKQDELGEWILVPALTLDVHIGCTCLACDDVWPPNQLSDLARQLGLSA